MENEDVPLWTLVHHLIHSKKEPIHVKALAAHEFPQSKCECFGVGLAI